MEKIRDRMAALRAEYDNANELVDELKATVKKLEQENLSKEQEITSLNRRNQLLEEEVEKIEVALKGAKDTASQSLQHDTQNEALQRRLQLLEEEAKGNDKTLRETNEKLRQTDIKAGHYEQKVQALEDQHAKLEQRYDDTIKEHSTMKKELDDLASQMADI
ncbi:uncharacterized protein N7500_009312 [Penicillium coprophilum]|uniref:uncharacterized protein n=1 Tax=Penicillium coprophilum TaxID=36646 RepID=UPI00238BD4E3|nr:uncharacterized protein N7500_009312 [Penicillium coprophilum]KAJ5153873.1 hypothetical protein N7500_009312 [Penicillium coprophilum]